VREGGVVVHGDAAPGLAKVFRPSTS
jgi:hypothetical protein